MPEVNDKWSVYKGHDTHVYYRPHSTQETTDETKFYNLNDNLGKECCQRVFLGRDVKLNQQAKSSFFIDTEQFKVIAVCCDGSEQTIEAKNQGVEVVFTGSRGDSVTIKIIDSDNEVVTIVLRIFSLFFLDLMKMKGAVHFNRFLSYLTPLTPCESYKKKLNYAYAPAFYQFALYSFSEHKKQRYFKNQDLLCEHLSEKRQQIIEGQTNEAERILVFLAKSLLKENGTPFPSRSSRHENCFNKWQSNSLIYYEGIACLNNLQEPDDSNTCDIRLLGDFHIEPGDWDSISLVRIYKKNNPDINKSDFKLTRQEQLKKTPFITFKVDEEETNEPKKVSLLAHDIFMPDSLHEDAEISLYDYVNTGVFGDTLESSEFYVQLLGKGYQAYTTSGLGFSKFQCLSIFSNSFPKDDDRMLKTLSHELCHVMGFEHKCGCFAEDGTACVMNYPESWLLDQSRGWDWLEEGSSAPILPWRVAGNEKGYSFCRGHLELLISR